MGRRTTLIESLLGITVSTLSDGCRIMVAGFTPDSEAKNDKNIKIGDWLKMINGIEVTVQNLNTVLEQISIKNEIVLQLQRVAGKIFIRKIHKLIYAFNYFVCFRC